MGTRHLQCILTGPPFAVCTARYIINMIMNKSVKIWIKRLLQRIVSFRICNLSYQSDLHISIFYSTHTKYLQIYNEPKIEIFHLHHKKSFSIFPSPARISLTKLSLAGIMMSYINYSRQGRVWYVTSRLWTGISKSFFYSVSYHILTKYMIELPYHIGTLGTRAIYV